MYTHAELALQAQVAAAAWPSTLNEYVRRSHDDVYNRDDFSDRYGLSL